jgi:cardiolipin synthase
MLLKLFRDLLIIREDDTGRMFADALIAKAREGVRVQLIYDWVGNFGKTSRKLA